MADRWKSFAVECRKGWVLEADALRQGATEPGSAIQLINFEPNANGGYRRISGYGKFDADAVPGTGPVQAVFVTDSHVYAARDGYIYRGADNGWTQINPSNQMATGNTFYRVEEYRNPNEVLVFCDGLNQATKWSNSTFTVLTAGPTAPIVAQWFSNHLFLAQGSVVTFSAPNDDENFTAADGAGEFNVGDDVVAFAMFRDNLIIFCQNSIHRVIGTSSADFVLKPITTNIGCVAGRSVQEIGGDLLFLSPDGVRPLSASERIGDFEIESVSRNITSFVKAFSNSTYICSAVVRGKTQYRLLSYVPGVSRENSQGIIAGLRLRDGALSYEWGELQGIQATCAHSGYFNDNELIVHGTIDGYVHKQEFGTSFDGFAIPAWFQTPYITFDDPNIRKTFYKIRVYLEIEGKRALQVSPILDYEDPSIVQPPPIDLTASEAAIATYGEATYGNVIYDTRLKPEVLGYLIGSFFSTSFRFYTNDTDPSFSIKSFVITYDTEGRR